MIETGSLDVPVVVERLRMLLGDDSRIDRLIALATPTT